LGKEEVWCAGPGRGAHVRTALTSPYMPDELKVEEQQYDRTLEVLNAAVPGDEELARLSHEAGERSAP